MLACSTSRQRACALEVGDEATKLRSSFPRRPPAKLQWDQGFAATPDQSSGYWGWGAEEAQVKGCHGHPLIACLLEVPVLGGGT